MRSNGSALFVALLVLIVAPGLAAASGIYVPALGPRAGSLGGAFIGLADDYSAVYWNPAGIVQIRGTEASVSAADVVLLASRDGTYEFQGDEGDPDLFAVENIRATSCADHHFAPGVFLFADPGPLKGILSKVGICAYTVVDYGARWEGEDVWDSFAWQGYDEIVREGDPPNYESRIRAYVISPVIATELSDKLSVGIAGHALYGHFELTNGAWVDTTAFVHNDTTSVDTWTLHLNPYQMSEDLTGWAYGATVGALYRVSDRMSLGASVRTPMTVTFDGTVEVTSTSDDYVSPLQNESFDFTFPMWAGAGFAYRDFMFDGMTLTADVQWTQWSKVSEIAREVDNDLPNGLGTTTLDWENTLEFGFGLEYRVSRSVSMRFGYRSSPSPVPDSTYDFAMPVASKSVIGVGVGYRRDVWALDMSLVYQAGQKRRLAVAGDEDHKYLDDVMVPSLSLTYGF